MADAELKARFAPDRELEPDVLGELQSMMRLHGLSAEDLFFKWESYCIRMEVDAQAPTLAAVRSLKQSIQDALEESRRLAQAKPERRAAATLRAAADVRGLLDGLVPGTPAARAPGSRGGGSGSGSGSGSAASRKTATPGAARQRPRAPDGGAP